MKPASLHFCTSEAWGGLELYACTLMEALKESGFPVFAVCRKESKTWKRLRASRIETVHLPSASPVSLSTRRFLREFIRQQEIAALHVHFHSDVWHASLAVRDTPEKRLIVGVYMGVSSKNDILHRWIFRRIDAVVTSSSELCRKLPSVYPVDAGRIQFLPYGRRIEEYRVDEAKRREIRLRHGVGPDELLAGTFLRIDPDKGVMDFAGSYRYIEPPPGQSVKFMIVGEPTRKARVRGNESPFEEHSEAFLREVERYISDNGLSSRIILTGFQDDLVGYLSAMDVFVFPSRNELYSLAVLDAMGMGLPVLASRAGGNIEQIDEQSTGMFFEVANSKDLAVKLSAYLRDAGLRASRGAGARRFVAEHHDMKLTVRRLQELYSPGGASSQSPLIP